MRLMLMVMSCLVIIACEGQSEEVLKRQDIDMHNPALAFCLKQGGELFRDNTAMEERYLCELADGSKVEVWEFYRDYQ